MKTETPILQLIIKAFPILLGLVTLFIFSNSSLLAQNNMNGGMMKNMLSKMDGLMKDDKMMKNRGMKTHMDNMMKEMNSMMKNYDGMLNKAEEMQKNKK
jgi:thiamine phosphate synthase YjbQ (UPF0047 family)